MSKLIKEHAVMVVKGEEGPCLYINDYRVAGPKPWGGGEILYTFKFDDEDWKEAVKMLKLLKPVEPKKLKIKKIKRKSNA